MAELMDNAAPITIRMQEWSRFPASRSDALTHVTLPDDSSLQALIQALARQNKLHVTEMRHGLVIETTSYVGKVTLGPLEIIIEPKTAGLPLMRLLRYAFDLPPLDRTDPAGFAVTARTFQDMLIQELAQQAERLITRGLRREYVPKEAALTSPRGRIDLGRLACSGGSSGATLPCRFHERREDTLLNRALRAGLSLGALATSDGMLRARLRRLCAMMDEDVSPLRLDGQALRQARRALNRLTAAYRPVITLIALLWEDQGLSLEAEPTKVPSPGFLFDMNRFFQALLSRFLSENLPGYRLEDERRLLGTFEYDPHFNPRRRQAPVPRPDFSLWQGGHLAAILDAKYRDLWEKHLPAEWLYQLAIYAVSHTTARTATILYPHVGASAQESRITVRDPVSGHGFAHVVLRPVDLEALDAAVGSGATAGARRNRGQMAHELAFGSG